MTSLNECDFGSLPYYVQNIISTIQDGNLKLLKLFVNNAEASSRTIGWWWDCYSNITSKSQLECLEYVINSPVFRFDAPFVCACCYFTPISVRNLVLKHKKAKEWCMNPRKFRDDAVESYTHSKYSLTSGIQARLFYGASEVTRHYNLFQKVRCTVLLYMFFTRSSRAFREQYYAPTGKGYLNLKAGFEEKSRMITANS